MQGCDYCSLPEVKVKEEFTVVEGLVGVGNAVTTRVVDDAIGGGTEAVAALVMEGLEGVDTGVEAVVVTGADVDAVGAADIAADVDDDVGTNVDADVHVLPDVDADVPPDVDVDMVADVDIVVNTIQYFIDTPHRGFSVTIYNT